MTHILLIFFIVSLFSGVVGLLMTGLIYSQTRSRVFLKRAGLILSFTLLIVADTISFYSYNARISPDSSVYTILGNIAIPCITFTLPLYIHTGLKIPCTRFLDKIFLGLAACSLILIMSIYIPKIELFDIFFIISGGILSLSILYSCVVVFFARKDYSHTGRYTALLMALVGILFFPGFVLIDIFRHFWKPFLVQVPFTVLFVPLYYLFLNILFIIYDASVLLKPGAAVPDLLTLSDSALESYNLSPREKEVCLLLLNGKRYNDIAEKLFISHSTVKTHIRKIYEKCGVSGKMELINLLFS